MPAEALASTSVEWMQNARCTQEDPDLFFPEKGKSAAAPKKVCGGCDVREQCLAYALANPSLEGVWGGLSKAERRRMLRKAAPGGDIDPKERDAQIIALRQEKTPLAEIAEQVGLTTRSVSRLLKQHTESQLAIAS